MPIRTLAASSRTLAASSRLLAVAAAALALLGGASPSTAAATANLPYVEPAYTLGFVDGIAPGEGPDLPDYVSIFIATATPDGEAPALQLLRGGVVLASKATAAPGHQHASLNLAELRAGDVARVVIPSTGAVVTEAEFDGLPRMESTTCGGSIVLAGVRRAGSRIHFVAVRRADSDGSDYLPGEGGDHQARITRGAASEPDDRIAGIFRFTLVSGQILSTQSSWWTGTTQVFNDIDSVVAPCPVTPVPATAPPSTAPGDALLPSDAHAVMKAIKLKRGARLASLVKPGVSVEITSDRGAKLVMKLVVRWTKSTKGKRNKVKLETIGELRADLVAGKLAKLKLRADKKKLGLMRKLAKQKRTKLIVSASLSAIGGTAKPLPSTTLPLPKS